MRYGFRGKQVLNRKENFENKKGRKKNKKKQQQNNLFIAWGTQKFIRSLLGQFHREGYHSTENKINSTIGHAFQLLKIDWEIAKKEKKNAIVKILFKFESCRAALGKQINLVFCQMVEPQCIRSTLFVQHRAFPKISTRI